MQAEIKNNLYEGIPLMKQDGTQINLGSRLSGKNRKITVEKNDMVLDQLNYLARFNIISVKPIRRRGTGN